MRCMKIENIDFSAITVFTAQLIWSCLRGFEALNSVLFARMNFELLLSSGGKFLHVLSVKMCPQYIDSIADDAFKFLFNSILSSHLSYYI